MNSYNGTMRGEHSSNHDTFTFDPSLQLPDSVGRDKYYQINNNSL